MNILWSLLLIFFHSKAVSQELSHTKWTKELPESIIIYEGEIFKFFAKCSGCKKPFCYLGGNPLEETTYEGDRVHIHFNHFRFSSMNYTYTHDLKCNTTKEVQGELIEDAITTIISFRIQPKWVTNDLKLQTKRGERIHFTAKYNITKGLQPTFRCENIFKNDLFEMSQSNVEGELVAHSREPQYDGDNSECVFGDGMKTSNILAVKSEIVKNPAAIRNLSFSQSNRVYINEVVTLQGAFDPIELGNDFYCEHETSTVRHNGKAGKGTFSFSMRISTNEMYGSYRCKVTNVDGTKGYVSVVLEKRFVSPKWSKSPPPLTLLPDNQQYAYMEIELASMDPLVQIHCLFYGEDEVVPELKRQAPGKLVYAFTWTAIDVSDFGVYECTALSKDGTDSIQFEVSKEWFKNPPPITTPSRSWGKPEIIAICIGGTIQMIFLGIAWKIYAREDYDDEFDDDWIDALPRWLQSVFR